MRPRSEGNISLTVVPRTEGNTGLTMVPRSEGNTGLTMVPRSEGSTGTTKAGTGNSGAKVRRQRWCDISLTMMPRPRSPVMPSSEGSTGLTKVTRCETNIGVPSFK